MRTDAKLDELCDALTLHHGDMVEAARYSGVSTMFITRWMKDDAEAAERLKEAQQVGYLGLENEARRRAVDGVEEDVFYKGEVVGKKVNYSDSLLSKLLEANVQKFSKKADQGGNNFLGPTQINIMPRADSYEAWLGMKKATLEVQEEAPALEGPKVPEVLQGQYVDYEEVPDDQDQKPLGHLKDLGL